MLGSFSSIPLNIKKFINPTKKGQQGVKRRREGQKGVKDSRNILIMGNTYAISLPWVRSKF